MVTSRPSLVTSPSRERPEVWSRRGNDKCEFLARESANLWPILARQGDVTSVSLLPSHYFRLSLSLSLSPIVPHAQYRKRFRASYNIKKSFKTFETLFYEKYEKVSLFFFEKKRNFFAFFIDLMVMKTLFTARLPVTVSSMQTWWKAYGKKFSPGHSYPQADICSAPYSDHDDIW